MVDLVDVYSLPEPLRQIVSDELEGGERIRWLAQPISRSSFPWVSLFPFFFGIPWTLFALWWIAGAAGVLDPFNGFKGFGHLEAGRVVFALFGIPFVLVGVGMLASPFWIRRRHHRAAKRTAYVITDRRAIIFDGGYYGDTGLATVMGGMVRFFGKGTNIRSYPPDQLRNVQRIQREDGSGDVLFGEVLFTSESGDQRQITRAGFFSVPDVKEVEELLKALSETGRTPDWES